MGILRVTAFLTWEMICKFIYQHSTVIMNVDTSLAPETICLGAEAVAGDLS